MTNLISIVENSLNDKYINSGNSLFNEKNDVFGDSDVTNHSGNSPVSKAIDNPQTNGGYNNLWWIILAIIAVIIAGAIIKKYMK